MQVLLLDATATEHRLSKLIKKHDRIAIAVAWGGITSISEVLLANLSKLESMLLGLDFSATDPDLIDRFVDVPNAFVAKNRPGCFHPKIFYFHSDAKAEAIIGSANLTKGGLGKNFEACVHAKGAASHPFFEQVRAQLESYTNLRLPITKSLADGYRCSAEAAAKFPRPKNPTLPNNKQDWKRVTSPLATMSWQAYAKAARQDLHHDFRKRMKLVREIQKMFAKTASFSDLAVAEWKGIAGVLGDREAEAAELAGFEWGWFGSMGGAGTFAELIGQKNTELGNALDAVPKRGVVTREQFDDFAAAFTAAFAGASRTAGLAPATRLLAMKRPDIFVCVNGGNTAGLAKALSFAPTTIRLNNYWERVIQPIQLAPWYNAPRPTGRDMELWDARVAMLDAIFYEPVG